jgi:hypothetical protein
MVQRDGQRHRRDGVQRDADKLAQRERPMAADAERAA